MKLDPVTLALALRLQAERTPRVLTAPGARPALYYDAAGMLAHVDAVRAQAARP